jgi:molecular chaperone GrpE
LNAKSGRHEPSKSTLASDAGAELPATADDTELPLVLETPEAGTSEPAGAGPETTEDYRDRWLRAVADLQNFRRRGQREVEDARRVAEERVMLELIAAMDDLERALAAARESGAPDAWTQGVQLVVQRLAESLARHGVTPLDPIGEAFDPREHEAMLEVESRDVAPGHVVQVAQRGYRRGDRVLRAARVVVARHPAGREV